MYWFSRRMTENTEAINLINELCDRKYGIFLVGVLAIIPVLTLQLLNGIEWLKTSNSCMVPDWITYCVVCGGYSLFSLMLWIVNGLYDPVSALLIIFIDNVKRAKVNSLLAGGVMEPQ
jgi:hypothetical protein